MSLQPFLKQISSGQNLNVEQAEDAFSYIISGQATPVQISGFLMGLAARGETTQELTGAVKAMRAKAVTINAPDNAIDCCGTGGDCSGSLNISTAASFVVAGCGVPMAKHGNRSASSKSGAADVLEALGVNLGAAPEQMQTALKQHNICFMMATNFHPAAKYVAPIRTELGTRTTFNLLGPLLNPAGTKRQLIGVFDQKWCTPMAEVLKTLGSEFAWIVHGSDGLDEITTTGTTHITELNTDGSIRNFDIHPSDIGIKTSTLKDIQGGDAAYNAKRMTALLDGKHDAYRDIVLINSAAALIVAGHAPDLQSGLKMATSALDNGSAKTCLNGLIEVSNAK